MVEIRGWIILPCEIAGSDHGGDTSRAWEQVYEKILELSGGKIARIDHHVQNVMVGISLFDFSNHAGEKLPALRSIAKYLNALGSAVQASIVFTDYETEEMVTLEVGRPFGWY